ncbi:aspartate carbamoyltransferase [Methylomonas montana]|uniref:aspartate carbamoyltransferase n=1 Tax=Methylomonas montana TaxID=3058963 RepID=UPI002658D36C|nr:aspartate carbamoyltransferase [Methylomonas montana]WKJ88654.1 aspartate carbamoyltransferase [Methylomonas montana]
MKKHPLIIIAGLLVFSTASVAVEQASAKQANAAQQLIPYSLAQTVQTFSKTVHGGVQHVVVKSADNARDIKLIQTHLAKLAVDFSKGDFSVTEKLHGADMPGLARLKMAKTDDIRFDYKALANGGQIHYASEYPQYIQALHEWFEAQAAEHGATVAPGHAQHHMAPAE